MTTLIAEDLVLLLLDDESGKFTNATYLDTGIGGALLVELALNQTVEVVKGSGLWARAKVRPTGLSAPSDPVLAEALALVGEKERRPRTSSAGWASGGATSCWTGSGSAASSSLARTVCSG